MRGAWVFFQPSSFRLHLCKSASIERIETYSPLLWLDFWWKSLNAPASIDPADSTRGRES